MARADAGRTPSNMEARRPSGRQDGAPKSYRDRRWVPGLDPGIKRTKKHKPAPAGHKRQIETAVPVSGYENVGINPPEEGFPRGYSATDALAHETGLAAVLVRDNPAGDV
jgi:hypothetical protein